MVETVVGVGSCVLCVVLFGSQSVFVKLGVVARSKVSPAALGCQFSIGVFLVGIVGVIAILSAGTSNQAFNLYGVAGAAVWAPGTLLMLIATEQCGVAITSGLVTATSSVFAFCLGVGVVGEVPNSYPAAIFGLLLIIGGIFAITYTKLDALRERDSNDSASDEDERGALLQSSADEFLSARPRLRRRGSTLGRWNSAAGESVASSSGESSAMTKARLLRGGTFAFGTGILYGAQGPLVEMAAGVPFAYATTQLLAQLPMLTGLYACYALGTSGDNQRLAALRAVLSPHFLECGWLAMASGGVFGVGLYAQVLCVDAFGSAVGFPLTQLNLIVASAWAVLFLGEFVGFSAKLKLAAGIAALLGGAMLLAVG